MVDEMFDVSRDPYMDVEDSNTTQSNAHNAAHLLAELTSNDRVTHADFQKKFKDIDFFDDKDLN